MNESNISAVLGLRIACLLGAAALAVWALWPDARPYAAGFLLGLLFSLINGWYLVLKVQQIGRLATNRVKRTGGIGFVFRAALSVLAVAIAATNDRFDVLMTIIGLLYIYAFIIFSGLISHVFRKKN